MMTLKIDGMICASCTEHVRQALEKVPGVRSAAVSYSKALADVVHREYQAGDVVVCDGEYANASSVNFYTGIPLRILNGRENALWYGSYFPDAPKIFDDDSSFQRLWRSPQRVFFLTSDAHGPEKVRTMGVPYYQLLRSGEKGVYSNQPARR